jgi:medium-chain acyl-[acyl-carrier-protein] hydrolase
VTKWLWLPQPRPAACLRLYCLAHAGAGASVFAAWGLAAPRELEIAALQLPGRETRVDEEPLRTLASAAELIAEVIASNDKRPFALFGHSLGGKLALRVALLLEKTDHRPSHLFVSGASAASIPQDKWLHKLDDDQFIRSVANRFGGLPTQITDDQKIWSLFERPLRADLEASETDTLTPRPLGVPLTVISGTRDTVVYGNELSWQAWSNQLVHYERIDADHFSYRTEPRLYLEVIAKHLFVE